jgi:hypothetical protein
LLSMNGSGPQAAILLTDASRRSTVHDRDRESSRESPNQGTAILDDGSAGDRRVWVRSCDAREG